MSSNLVKSQTTKDKKKKRLTSDSGSKLNDTGNGFARTGVVSRGGVRTNSSGH